MKLNDRQLCDLEMILNGGFNPLQGFMNSKDYLSVLNNCKLEDGTIWPIPITLSISKKENIKINQKITLTDKNNIKIAFIHVEEIYTPDIDLECLKTLATNDPNHPYVNYLKNLGYVYYIGGKVEKIEGIKHYDFLDYRLTPKKLKNITKSYDRILGFQTRNPMHNCHYYLTLNSLDKINTDNKILALMPVVGITQNNDVDYSVRVRCYLHILEKYKKEGIKVQLCLLTLSMRMAGPREALWHAIIRQNYGCTDFIIGRDHAGPSSKKEDGSSFYKPTEAHDFVKNFEKDLKINIIKSDMLVYDVSIKKYVLEKDCSLENKRFLSGTQLREKIRNSEKIPEWFTQDEISKELTNSNKGVCIYLIGLSGSGKTTLGLALKKRLEEKHNVTLLDGDIIRENLSQGLGFSKKDRSINVRRIGFVASLLVEQGNYVICSNIAPYDEDRLHNRSLISKKGKYLEVFVNTPLEICENRDVKGLYKKARKGEIEKFTGISDPFEIPSKSDITIIGKGDINKLLDNIISLI